MEPFAQLPGGEDEERSAGTSHEVIAGLLRSIGEKAEKLRSYILEDVAVIESCDELRRRLVLEKPGQAADGPLGVLPLHDELEPPVGIAVDSTFPPEGGIDMVAGVLVGIVAGYIAYRGGQSLVKNGVEKRGLRVMVDILPRSEDLGKLVSTRARLLERRLVMSVMEALPEGSIVVFDGEIVPYTLLFTRPKRRVTRILDEETARLLEEARRRRITLAGVVKRSYTKLFNVYASSCGKKLRLNDKAVASLYLAPGEYSVIGSYAEVLPRYAELVAEERGASGLPRVVEERLGTRPSYGEIHVGFYKPSRVPRSWQAVKVEVYAPWMEPVEAFRKVASHLDSLTSPATGLPYPVDMIDEIVRIEASALEIVRHRLTKLLLRGLRGMKGPLRPEDVMVVTLYTNPEKRYLYQPR